MIDKSYGRYCIVCDACGEISADKFETWHDAVDRKPAGYTSKLYQEKDTWIDLCEDCNGKQPTFVSGTKIAVRRNYNE